MACLFGCVRFLYVFCGVEVLGGRIVCSMCDGERKREAGESCAKERIYLWSKKEDVE
jgi:hypothetical protein